VRFELEAPPECPNVSEFSARVRQRTSRGRMAEPGELARSFFLRVVPEGASFVGSVELLDDGGTIVSRRVRGEQCDAVISSLALITALALDATLKEEPPGPPPAPSEPGPQSQPEPRTEAPSKPPARPRREASGSGIRGARIGSSGGYGTTIDAFAYGLLGQVDWRNGFALRVAAHYASGEPMVGPSLRAHLRLMGVRASGCYWSLRIESLAITPCLGVDVGSLRGRGIESEALPHAYSGITGFAAVGPELRWAWEPSAPFWLELQADLQFPLVAHEFHFQQPLRQVYEVPRVAASVGLATGVRFW
jgi:hypothetical protein